MGERQDARSAGNKERQHTQRTAAPAADGFLRHTFTPLYEPATGSPKQKETEQGFYRSLSFLKKHYGLQLDDHRKLPYPYNILRSTDALDRALRTFGRSRQLEVVQHEAKVSLTVSEQFRNHYDLYYIPIDPLYDLWQMPDQQATAQLLTAVCAYLYVEAGICYYRDEDTYMHYNYEILEEWVAEDDDNEAKNARQPCLDLAKQKGDYLQEKMMDKALLKNMDILIASFQPATGYQHEALRIARQILSVWQAFPDNNLYQNLSAEMEDDETGHESRLNREMNEKMGSLEYAHEELRAFIAAILIGGELKLGHDFGQHKAYMGPFMRILKDDPFEIAKASRDAQKITDMVVGRDRERSQQQGSSKAAAFVKGDQIAYMDTTYKVLEILKSKNVKVEDADGTKRTIKPTDVLYGSLLEAKSNPREPVAEVSNEVQQEQTYRMSR